MVKKKKKIKVDPRLSTNTDFIDALPKREQRRLKKEAEALKKLEQTQAQLKIQRQQEELAKKLAAEERKEIEVQQPRTRTNIYHRPVPATNKQLEKPKKEKSSIKQIQQILFSPLHSNRRERVVIMYFII